MPNEHPMMSREEYHRRFPDDPTGPVERLTPDEEVLVNALRSVVGGALSPLGLYHLTGLLRIIERLSGDGTPPLDPECCVHCGENEYGKADDACWWCYMIAKQTAETAIEELNAMRGRAKPSEYEVERVAKAIWNAQYTHLDAETLFGDPCNPYWVEAANEARAQARAAIEALRGRAEPAEGERLTDWTNEESVPKEVVLAFQRECENIDPDSVPSYWTVAAALVAAMNVRAALRDGGQPTDEPRSTRPKGIQGEDYEWCERHNQRMTWFDSSEAWFCLACNAEVDAGGAPGQ